MTFWACHPACWRWGVYCICLTFPTSWLFKWECGSSRLIVPSVPQNSKSVLGYPKQWSLSFQYVPKCTLPKRPGKWVFLNIHHGEKTMLIIWIFCGTFRPWKQHRNNPFVSLRVKKEVLLRKILLPGSVLIDTLGEAPSQRGCPMEHGWWLAAISDILNHYEFVPIAINCFMGYLIVLFDYTYWCLSVFNATIMVSHFELHNALRKVENTNIKSKININSNFKKSPTLPADLPVVWKCCC